MAKYVDDRKLNRLFFSTGDLMRQASKAREGHNMKLSGAALDAISRFTGLSQEEIESLSGLFKASGF